MLMALGLFVFAVPTLAYDELQRRTDWKHATAARIGARDATQFIGPGAETVLINGSAMAELSDGRASLDQLRTMANSGDAWSLVDGAGRVYGAFVITGIDERHKALFPDPDRLRHQAAARRRSRRRGRRAVTIANIPDFCVTLGDVDLTPRIKGTVRDASGHQRSRLISLTISEKRGGEADQLDLVLDDSDGKLALPPPARCSTSSSAGHRAATSHPAWSARAASSSTRCSTAARPTR